MFKVERGNVTQWNFLTKTIAKWYMDEKQNTADEKQNSVSAAIIRMPIVFPCKQVMQNWVVPWQNSSNCSK